MSASRLQLISYSTYRGEPPELVMSFLKRELRLARRSRVVDVGCGTGRLLRRLRAFGANAIGVEPEAGMRRLSGMTGIHAGSAERIPLGDSWADFVIACQAYLSFDAERAPGELARVLKDGGRLVFFDLVWPARLSGFMRAYRAFLKKSFKFEIDSPAEKRRRHRQAVKLFGGDVFHSKSLGDVETRLTWDELLGRFLAASYAPAPGSPELAAAVVTLRELFGRHAVRGRVRFKLRAVAIYGVPNRSGHATAQ
ncbi:MAG TPA: class I SAM-dependent methyltransferase [Bdellovibrionales bacterium]|nr:class I SAM-dependent methyltransferase [Bdellovibrionales bacterium]